ncbi:MAG: hypothetical protein LBT40_05430 [Deltaproteobacteria bacterium]|jgi:hypothetical protein|nr:hypothetical protein [Deltaproteobacteria bacterium]
MIQTIASAAQFTAFFLAFTLSACFWGRLFLRLARVRSGMAYGSPLPLCAFLGSLAVILRIVSLFGAGYEDAYQVIFLQGLIGAACEGGLWLLKMRREASERKLEQTRRMESAERSENGDGQGSRGEKNGGEAGKKGSESGRESGVAGKKGSEGGRESGAAGKKGSAAGRESGAAGKKRSEGGRESGAAGKMGGRGGMEGGSAGKKGGRKGRHREKKVAEVVCEPGFADPLDGPWPLAVSLAAAFAFAVYFGAVSPSGRPDPWLSNALDYYSWVFASDYWRGAVDPSRYFIADTGAWFIDGFGQNVSMGMFSAVLGGFSLTAASLYQITVLAWTASAVFLLARGAFGLPLVLCVLAAFGICGSPLYLYLVYQGAFGHQFALVGLAAALSAVLLPGRGTGNCPGRGGWPRFRRVLFPVVFLFMGYQAGFPLFMCLLAGSAGLAAFFWTRGGVLSGSAGGVPGTDGVAGRGSSASSVSAAFRSVTGAVWPLAVAACVAAVVSPPTVVWLLGRMVSSATQVSGVKLGLMDPLLFAAFPHVSVSLLLKASGGTAFSWAAFLGVFMAMWVLGRRGVAAWCGPGPPSALEVFGKVARPEGGGTKQADRAEEGTWAAGAGAVGTGESGRRLPGTDVNGGPGTVEPGPGMFGKSGTGESGAGLSGGVGSSTGEPGPGMSGRSGTGVAEAGLPGGVGTRTGKPGPGTSGRSGTGVAEAGLSGGVGTRTGEPGTGEPGPGMSGGSGTGETGAGLSGGGGRRTGGPGAGEPGPRKSGGSGTGEAGAGLPGGGGTRTGGPGAGQPGPRKSGGSGTGESVAGLQGGGGTRTGGPRAAYGAGAALDALSLTFLLSLLAYLGVYVARYNSYQLWKFAAMTALPLSFVVPAMAFMCIGIAVRSRGRALALSVAASAIAVIVMALAAPRPGEGERPSRPWSLLPMISEVHRVHGETGDVRRAVFDLEDAARTMAAMALSEGATVRELMAVKGAYFIPDNEVFFSLIDRDTAFYTDRDFDGPYGSDFIPLSGAFRLHRWDFRDFLEKGALVWRGFYHFTGDLTRPEAMVAVMPPVALRGRDLELEIRLGQPRGSSDPRCRRAVVLVEVAEGEETTGAGDGAVKRNSGGTEDVLDSGGAGDAGGDGEAGTPGGAMGAEEPVASNPLELDVKSLVIPLPVVAFSSGPAVARLGFPGFREMAPGERGTDASLPYAGASRYRGDFMGTDPMSLLCDYVMEKAYLRVANASPTAGGQARDVPEVLRDVGERDDAGAGKVGSDAPEDE